MAKYYIKSGTLEIIYSSDKPAFEAAQDCVWELNDHDTLDEYFYIDERGYRDYVTADPTTMVYESEAVLNAAGWNIEDD
jgi:hypothetical protein